MWVSSITFSMAYLCLSIYIHASFSSYSIPVRRPWMYSGLWSECWYPMDDMIISDSTYNHFLSLQLHLALDDFGKVVWTIQGNDTVHQFHERSNHWNLKTWCCSNKVNLPSSSLLSLSQHTFLGIWLDTIIASTNWLAWGAQTKIVAPFFGMCSFPEIWMSTLHQQIGLHTYPWRTTLSRVCRSTLQFSQSEFVPSLGKCKRRGQNSKWQLEISSDGAFATTHTDIVGCLFEREETLQFLRLFHDTFHNFTHFRTHLLILNHFKALIPQNLYEWE